jgi:hypothetical protein
MHNQLFAQPTISHQQPPPFSRTHSRMHAFASPPRHQPQTRSYLETAVFGARTRDYLETKVFGTRHEIIYGNLTTAKKHKYQKEILYEYYRLSQTTYAATMGRVHSISRLLQRHVPTIFTSHHHHQPKPPTEPSNHNSMSARTSCQFILQHT